MSIKAMDRRISLLFILALLMPYEASAALCSRILTFADGNVLTASQLNSEFNNAVDCANSITDANIPTSANISPAKINSIIAGDGLGRNSSTGQLSVNVDDSTIEIDSDTLRVKADGITASHLRDDGSVDANRAVTTNHIRDSAITTAKIADSNVTTAKIADVNVTTAKIADGAITQAKRAALTTQTSSSCGSFVIPSASFSDVTNMTVTLTATGRPIMIGIKSDAGGAQSEIEVSGGNAWLKLIRTVAPVTGTVGEYRFGSPSVTTDWPTSSASWFDTGYGGAGTVTYVLQAKHSSLGSIIENAVLYAYEL